MGIFFTCLCYSIDSITSLKNKEGNGFTQILGETTYYYIHILTMILILYNLIADYVCVH